MSSHPDIIRVYTSVNIDSDLIDAAKVECDRVDLNTTATFMVFQPGETCGKIIESVKERVRFFVVERISVDARKLTQRQRKVHARSVIVLFPGATNEYLQSPCIVIPIEKDGLPANMTTEDGTNVTVDWDAGRAWEVLQDVRLAPVNRKGGTLLVLRVV